MFREPGQITARKTTEIKPTARAKSRWYVAAEDFLQVVSADEARPVISAFDEEYVERRQVPATGEAADWTQEQIEFEAVQDALIYALDKCPFCIVFSWRGSTVDEAVENFDYIVTRAGFPSLQAELNAEFADEDDSLIYLIMVERVAKHLNSFGWSVASVSIGEDSFYIAAKATKLVPYDQKVVIPASPFADSKPSSPEFSYLSVIKPLQR